MLVRGVFVLIGRRDRAAVRVMQAKLRERNFVKDRCLGELASRYRQQQRLHDQSIDRNDADQPSPERAQFRVSLIWSGWHAHKRRLLYRVRDEAKFRRGATIDSSGCDQRRYRADAVSIVGGVNVATPATRLLRRRTRKEKLADME